MDSKSVCSLPKTVIAPSEHVVLTSSKPKKLSKSGNKGLLLRTLQGRGGGTHIDTEYQNIFPHTQADLKTIGKDIENYLKDVLELSDGNVERNIRKISTLKRTYNITVPNQAALLKLKEGCRKRGCSPDTTRLYMWALRYWGASKGVKIDFKDIPLPKTKKKLPKALPFNVVRELLNDTDMPLRDKSLYATLAYAGSRITETVKLRLSTDIDTENQSLIFRETKDNEERIVPLPDEAWQILLEWMEYRAEWLATNNMESDFLFINARGKELTDDASRTMMRRYRKRKGIDGLHPHAFRHTAAMKLLQTPGITIYDVKSTLGHKNINTTLKYLSDDLEHRKKVTKGLSY